MSSCLGVRIARSFVRPKRNRRTFIVMGAQGRGGIGLALFGSTTQQVVRGAMCPVLTVRAQREIQGRFSESSKAASVA